MSDEEFEIPDSHPRAESLRIRERLIKGFKKGLVAYAGLIAHGRGEAFDYILGEKTHDFAAKAMRAAVALFLLAKHPVFSVNGNVAALVPEAYVKLAKLLNAKLEVNLFYRTREREERIRDELIRAGAKEVLGVDDEYRTEIPEIKHLRRFVDSRGIYIADVVFVPLEDGDRTSALIKLGKKVVTIDLNPLSRTAQWATITIVDNLVRAVPRMINIYHELSGKDSEYLREILRNYDNSKVLSEAIRTMRRNLDELAEKGVFIDEARKFLKTGNI